MRDEGWNMKEPFDACRVDVGGLLLDGSSPDFELSL
jgi:hypothetical protein